MWGALTPATHFLSGTNQAAILGLAGWSQVSMSVLGSPKWLLSLRGRTGFIVLGDRNVHFGNRFFTGECPASFLARRLRTFSETMRDFVRKSRCHRKTPTEALSNALRADMGDVEALHVDASATCAEVLFQGGLL